MTKKISASFLQLFLKPAPRRTLRGTLRELHTSGTISVFRRHSFLNLWTPLRENLDSGESWAN